MAALTVGELRKLIADMPDDVIIVAGVGSDHRHFECSIKDHFVECHDDNHGPEYWQYYNDVSMSEGGKKLRALVIQER